MSPLDLFSRVFGKTPKPAAARRHPAYRPIVESLEDRRLLSAGFDGNMTLTAGIEENVYDDGISISGSDTVSDGNFQLSTQEIVIAPGTDLGEIDYSSFPTTGSDPLYLPVTSQRGLSTVVPVTTEKVWSNGPTVAIPHAPVVNVIGIEFELNSRADVNKWSGEIGRAAREAYNQAVAIAKNSLNKLDDYKAQAASNLRAAQNNARAYGEFCKDVEQVLKDAGVGSSTATGHDDHATALAKKATQLDSKAKAYAKAAAKHKKQAEAHTTRAKTYSKKGLTFKAYGRKIRAKEDQVRALRDQTKKTRTQAKADLVRLGASLLESYSGIKQQWEDLRDQANDRLASEGLMLSRVGRVGPVEPVYPPGFGNRNPGGGSGGQQNPGQGGPPSGGPGSGGTIHCPGGECPEERVPGGIDIHAFEDLQQHLQWLADQGYQQAAQLGQQVYDNLRQGLSDLQAALASPQAQGLLQYTEGLTLMTAGTALAVQGMAAVGAGVATSEVGVGIPMIVAGGAEVEVGLTAAGAGYVMAVQAAKTLGWL